MNISEGIEKIYEECLGDYDGVIIWDVPSEYRNGLVKYCYGRNIRIYVMPKITEEDVAEAACDSALKRICYKD